MTDWAGVAVVVVALAMAGWCLVSVLRKATQDLAQLIGLGVLEVLVLVHAGYAVARMIGGAHPAEPVTFVGYLITFVLVVPIGATLAILERSHWGSVVLLVACLVVPVLVVRLNQVWTGVG